ncbi:hypothetical protein HAX54_035008 [Datura stramonium]|uniref:Pentatricopeptide repeat-containing protein n=1 Tax=Datura stramonium TaxID=4076 RepID=A0ABS8SER9_DATST|nr:hypothetical protein [Datura stramonium]
MIAGYAENLRLNEALQLFGKMPVKDTVMWNLMIKGCVDCGDMEMGLKLFEEMTQRNVISYTTMISGFLKFGEVEEAESLFREMPQRDVAAWNAMIYGYFENGRVEEAVKLFEMMPYRNVISWTSVISGLDQHGRRMRLIDFKKMLDFFIEPTSSTFASVITACANARDLSLGSEIHASVVKLGYLYDTYVTASLITLYANCMHMDDSSMYSARLHINILYGHLFDRSSFTSALNSSCEMESIDLGKEIHGVAVKLGLNTDAFVGTSCIMVRSRADMDDITFTGLLAACSHSGMLEKGRRLFQYIPQSSSVEVTLEHYSCMVDILCRSGKLNEAEDLMKSMPMRPICQYGWALLAVL